MNFFKFLFMVWTTGYFVHQCVNGSVLPDWVLWCAGVTLLTLWAYLAVYLINWLEGSE